MKYISEILIVHEKFWTISGLLAGLWTKILFINFDISSADKPISAFHRSN